jgi:hypothetical protein
MVACCVRSCCCSGCSTVSDHQQLCAVIVLLEMDRKLLHLLGSLLEGMALMHGPQHRCVAGGLSEAACFASRVLSTVSWFDSHCTALAAPGSSTCA